MKNNKSKKLSNLIKEIKENEKVLVSKLIYEYVADDDDWYLKKIEEIHRIAIAAAVYNTIYYLIEKKNYDFFYETENGDKIFAIGIDYEENCLTAFDLQNFINRDYDEMEKEITKNNKRNIKYVDSMGAKYYAPTFSECDAWIEMILENLQNGNL